MDEVEKKESSINMTHAKPTVDNHEKQRQDFSQRYTIAVELECTQQNPLFI